MTEVVGVRFKPVGKIYYFLPGELNIKKGDCVVVETARGVETGTTVMVGKKIIEDENTKPLKKVIRIANEEDIERKEKNIEKERTAFGICEKKIKEHKLEMKLVEVEYAFDSSKVIFYFTADGRIDFRELVKDLATVLKTRIEMRQIGVRDEAKTIGSVGICGRQLCCAQFLGEFAPVSMKMAKDQGLSLNPTKISGACGRLMCCLKYEQDTYEELLSITPRQGSFVETPDGKGTVEYVNLIKGMLKVKLGDGKESTMQEFATSDVKILKRAAKIPKKDENFE